MLREEKYLEFLFEGRERIRVSDIWVEVVPDVRTEVGGAKATSLPLKRRSLSMRVCDEERREREGVYSCSSLERSNGGEPVSEL